MNAEHPADGSTVQLKQINILHETPGLILNVQLFIRMVSS